MRRFSAVLAFIMVFGAAAIVSAQDYQYEPLDERVVMQMETGKGVTTDDIQRLFRAITQSYLRSNNSYILGYEIYPDAGRQTQRSSLTLSELDYGDYQVTNIRYNFSNGYFEFKLSLLPFVDTKNDKEEPSKNYDGIVDAAMLDSINDTLQEGVYISRGYAARYRKTSTASFYLFLPSSSGEASPAALPSTYRYSH